MVQKQKAFMKQPLMVLPTIFLLLPILQQSHANRLQPDAYRLRYTSDSPMENAKITHELTWSSSFNLVPPSTQKLEIVNTPSRTHRRLQQIRGGNSTTTGKKKTKKKRVGTSGSSSSTHKKRKKSSHKQSNSEDGKRRIDDVIKSSDSAKFLGDAIRDRKEILQNDPILPPAMDMDDIDASLLSLGLSLGTSDPRSSSENLAKLKSKRIMDTYDDEMMDGGGVEASRTSILANYFLQSHGGAYAFQCTVSAFSVFTGLAAILLPILPFAPSSDVNTFNTLQMVFIRRCLLCALMKHASGLLAAAILSARRIPQIGLYETRRRVEALASDPVAQYLFYCSLLLVWLPVTVVISPAQNKVASDTGSATAQIASACLPWYLNSKVQRPSILAFLGPILLREIIHLVWVVYDVCTILGASPILTVAKSGIDALMSIVLTPSLWRKADSRKKQRLLAKLVARVSLVLELATGAIIGLDVFRTVAGFSLSPLDKRPKVRVMLTKVLCGRLYLNYMLVRKKKIVDLVGTIRGGAGHVPERILDVLLEPKKAMGIEDNKCNDNQLASSKELDQKSKKELVNLIGDALGI